MTQEELSEYNKRCAEFLGYKLITPEMRRNPEKWSYSYWQKDYPNKQDVLCGEKYLDFHSDWNLIMRVVEAIEELELGDLEGLIYDKYGNPDKHLNCKAGFEINHNRCNIYIQATMRVVDNFIDISGQTKKEAVVQAINQFLIWYNEKKTN